jgi:ATP-dependent helicase/DNAse subunit B
MERQKYMADKKLKNEEFLTTVATSFSRNFEEIFAHMEGLLANMNEDLRDGRIPVNPTDGLDKDACKYCDFAAVCGIEDKPHRKVERIDGDNMWNKFKGGEDNV